MLKRQELSLLNQQRGTVSTMAFTPDTSHLFVGDSSGALIAYSTATWEIHKVWPKAHKGHGVNLIRIHPSGKLAVTLGSELNMQLWNLIRGTCVNTTNLKVIPELGKIVDCLEWNPSGDFLAISGAKVVQIWNTRTAAVERSFPVPSQPTCVAWLSETELAIGMTSGEVLFRKNVEDAPENETKEQKMHEKRVKGMSLQMPYLATICSDGEVALFELDEEEFGQFTKVAQTNVGCRPTCVTLLDRSTYSDFKIEGDKEDGASDKEEEQATKVAKKNKGAHLSKGSVEIIEEEDDEDDEDVAPPPAKKDRRQSIVTKPGQFVMATPKKNNKQTTAMNNKTPTPNKKQQKVQQKEPASLKKKPKAKKQKLNQTIG